MGNFGATQHGKKSQTCKKKIDYKFNCNFKKLGVVLH